MRTYVLLSLILVAGLPRAANFAFKCRCFPEWDLETTAKIHISGE